MVTYQVSKVKYKDSDNTPRILEGQLESITLYSYYYQYQSSPDVTEILEDDVFYTFVAGNDIKRFRKDSVLWAHYKFKQDMQTADFIY